MRGGADPADPLDVDLPGQGRLHGAGRVGTAALVGVAVAVALGGWTGGVAGAAALTPAGAPGGCDTPVLDRPRHSADAIGGLGASIRSVAARSGTTAATLSRRLRADPTLWVNTCGLLYFADALPGDLPGTTGDGASWPATIDPADAFTLHSRPGADRVIYLDFDGQVITGTVWNSDYATASWADPAFSTDADASTFSSAERTAIVEVWQRVAQDFAPFAVDVTTQEPAADAITRSSSTDTRFGTRVLISPDDSQSECGCAGVAYLDAFDRTSNHAYLQPAWVYPDAVSNQARHIAEAVSHETGHTFGLLHDGT